MSLTSYRAAPPRDEIVASGAGGSIRCLGYPPRTGSGSGAAFGLAGLRPVGREVDCKWVYPDHCVLRQLQSLATTYSSTA